VGVKKVPLDMNLGLQQAVIQAVEIAFSEPILATEIRAVVDERLFRTSYQSLPPVLPDVTLMNQRVATRYGVVDVRFGAENCLVVTTLDPSP
jgi:hypothetical protein